MPKHRPLGEQGPSVDWVDRAGCPAAALCRMMSPTPSRRLGRRARVSPCNPHRVRRTFAINYIRNQGDVYCLQKILGHSSLEMVKRYLVIAQVDCESGTAAPDRWTIGGCESRKPPAPNGAGGPHPRTHPRRIDLQATSPHSVLIAQPPNSF